MSISLKLIDSNTKVAKDINKALALEINRLISKNTRIVQNKLKQRIPIWIKEQPEIASLGNDGQLGSLNSQFGLEFGTSDSAISAIANAVADSTQVKITKVGQTLKGGVEFLIQPSSFSNLLGLPQGVVRTKKGTNLHWLDWLLTKGSTVIISGYEYTPSFEGRSGGGVMSGGTVWRVPPQFAGTESNNFVTRALENRDKELAVILRELLNV